MIQWLKDKGIHLSLWMFPYLPAYAKDENGKTILGKESKLVEVMRERSQKNLGTCFLCGKNRYNDCRHQEIHRQTSG